MQNTFPISETDTEEGGTMIYLIRVDKLTFLGYADAYKCSFGKGCS